MNVLLYALATVACGALAVRAPLADREDPVRRSYAVLGLLVAVTWLGWTLHLLLPGVPVGKLLNGCATVFLPWALLRFITRFFVGRGEESGEPALARLGGFAPVVAVGYCALQLLVPWRFGQAGVADVLLGLWTLYGFTLTLRRLWRRHQDSKERVQRARIRYLLGLATAAIGFGFMEAIARAGSPLDAAPASFLTQEGLVQGALPPLGALLATTLLYFLYQMISLYRLLDLAEIFSRVGAVSIAAFMLVILASLSAVTLSGPYPTHGIFQAFVASVLFLLAWEPMRNQLERWLGALLNPRGLMLGDAMRDVELALPRAISVPALAATVLDRFVSSGRVPTAALYLWDEERRLYRLVAERGARPRPALLQVAREPFVEGFVSGEPAYLRVDLERQARRDVRRSEHLARRLEAMAGMNADLVIPLPSGDLVLGWFALADEVDGDGFSEEEIARMARLGLQAAGTVENIHSFDQLKQEHRLSGLGTMAAGLAHEIRNPLAGIRGAAQYLAASRPAEEGEGEMVQVIIDETDRLNRIVAQFLEYARQLRVALASVTAASVVGATARALTVEAERLGVELVEDCVPDTLAAWLDEDKLRQVLLNLGQNALRAMPDGGKLTLRARLGELADPRARHRPCVEFSVEDTGVGIAPEDLDRLFVPFFTTHHDGTGLGLAISQRIVQAHHGEIDVRSAVGRGSTFIVRIPLGDPAGMASG